MQAADTVSEGAASAMSCATAAGRELYERGMEMKQRQEQIREQLRKVSALTGKPIVQAYPLQPDRNTARKVRLSKAFDTVTPCLTDHTAGDPRSACVIDPL